FPGAHRQTVIGFAAPGNSRKLQAPILICVKDSAAEKNRKRDVTIFQAVKILGGSDVEVEGTRQRNSGERLTLKPRHDDGGVRPKKGAQGLAPARRGAEEVEEFVLLVREIAPPHGLNLNLALQENVLDLQVRLAAADPDLEQEKGRGCVRRRFHAADAKSQL